MCYSRGMDLDGTLRAARQWIPFISRTIAYGTISLALGPLTPDHRASLWAMRRWCETSARGLDLDVVAERAGRVPGGGFVYCSNHQSLLDILVLGAVLDGDYKWAAKRSLLAIPFLGWHLRLAGHVPVDRGAGPGAAAAVIDRFERVLAAGKPLLVFPEGTRSADGVLRPFKSGGFVAAVRAQRPVIPVALEGTHRLLRKGERSIGDGSVTTIKVVVGEAIQPPAGGDEADRVATLREATRAAIATQLRSIGGRAIEDAAAAAAA
jgi:1-acyl-sn-glycerol-3-phosphate acyltransferase